MAIGFIPGSIRLLCQSISMDWFQEKPTGSHSFFHETLGFHGCKISHKHIQ